MVSAPATALVPKNNLPSEDPWIKWAAVHRFFPRSSFSLTNWRISGVVRYPYLHDLRNTRQTHQYCQQHEQRLKSERSAPPCQPSPRTMHVLADELVHFLVFAKLAHIWTHDDQCAIVLTATRVTIRKYSGDCSVRVLVTEFSVWYKRAEP